MNNKVQRGDSSLGPQLVGEKITIDRRVVQVTKLLGEGGFSFAYLVKDLSDNSTSSANNSNTTGDGGSQQTSLSSKVSNSNSGSFPDFNNPNNFMVLKITAIHSRHHREIAEKEAKLLSRLSHPSIVRIFDSCFRGLPTTSSGNILTGNNGGARSTPQHLILMEYCDGGNALTMINELKTANKRFDTPSLIIAFGQICNAVSYLHAQRPPIVHRDLKPVNFLVKNGAFKLGDFGSAVIGHVDLKTPEARAHAEEVIQKTTTQMFRSPEMVDLYMAKRLTQSTDIWALGCCLYSLAFFQNCFEEGSNLAILSSNYKIPDDNPYGEGIVDLLDRMLTVNDKGRADISEVILCLSALYSDSPLPPRKKMERSTKKNVAEQDGPRVGTYRTDGQGIVKAFSEESSPKPAEAKKLNPNSAASRRLKASLSLETRSTSYGKADDKAKNTTLPLDNKVQSFNDTQNLFADDPFDFGHHDNRKTDEEINVSFESLSVSLEKGSSPSRLNQRMNEEKESKKESKPLHALSGNRFTFNGGNDKYLDSVGVEISLGNSIGDSSSEIRGASTVSYTKSDGLENSTSVMKKSEVLNESTSTKIKAEEKEETKKKRFTFRRQDAARTLAI